MTPPSDGSDRLALERRRQYLQQAKVAARCVELGGQAPRRSTHRKSAYRIFSVDFRRGGERLEFLGVPVPKAAGRSVILAAKISGQTTS
jgi:hypothetical protein